MYFIEFGTEDAVEGYRDETSDDPERVRYRPVEGQRIVTMSVPDGVSLNEAFRTVAAALELHIANGTRPVWVQTNSEHLTALLADLYRIGDSNIRPEHWGEETSARLGAHPGMLTTLLALTIAFVFTKLLGLELRTDAGRDFQSRVMGDSASNGTGAYAPAKYIGVTANAVAPAAGNTVLAGEVTVGSLARAQATYAHVNGTATYTLTKTFTSDQAIVVAKMGVFNGAGPGGAASVSNTLVFETLLSDTASMYSGDQTQITQTVTL